jgi:hypothetical protein
MNGWPRSKNRFGLIGVNDASMNGYHGKTSPRAYAQSAKAPIGINPGGEKQINNLIAPQLTKLLKNHTILKAGF